MPILTIRDMLPTISQMDRTGLGDLRAAIRAREEQLPDHQAANIKRGDIVYFSSRIRPTYLRGLTAEVVRTNPKSITVKIPVDARYGRFSGSQRCRLPNALIGGKAEPQAQRKATAGARPRVNAANGEDI